MAYRLVSRFQFCLRKATGSPWRAVHLSAPSLKLVQFLLSDIGEGIREVTVRDWFVNRGDTVAQFDDICLVESDKASVNITSRYDGVVKKLYYQVGEVALVGQPLVDIDVQDSGEDSSSSDSDAAPTESKVEPSKQDNRETDVYINKALATPAVRRIAKQYNIDLKAVQATGKAGRVLKEDILNYINRSAQETRPDRPSLTESPVRSSIQDEVRPITGVKKVMVSTMTKSGAIPTFGYCDDVDMTKLVNLRADIKEIGQKKGLNITYMPFFIKALSKALEEYPELNASVDDKCENVYYKKHHNIGFAVDTKAGLIVPNIKNVRDLTILQIAREIDRILETGRKGVLSPSDLTGGTITISNIGIIGGTYLRPLILPPELAIVALGRTQVKPVFNDSGEVVKAHIMNASWAGDHRIIDGATMARFANLWKYYVENPSVLLMDL